MQKMLSIMCRQEEFTLEEEDGEGADTDMERGQLLSLSALSSHSLPAVATAAGNIAMQSLSKLQEGGPQGIGDHAEVAEEPAA